MKINKIISFVCFIVLIIVLYHTVFFSSVISGGDYISATMSQLEYWKKFSFFVWDGKIDMGWSIVPLLAYAPYSFFIGILGSIIHESVVVELLVWWLPCIGISSIGSLLLVRKIFPNIHFAIFSPLIFCFNTYILLLIGGGQISSIGLVYGLAPLLFYVFISVLEEGSLYKSIGFGLLLSIVFLFDIRMIYVLLVMLGLYTFFYFLFYSRKEIFKKIFFVYIVPFTIVILLHMYWLLPFAIVRQNPLQQLGSAYDSTSSVQFFSFAKFENTFGLLHPNWPENIFGKVTFMRPEFLFLPLFAYSSLLFIKTKKVSSYAKKENHYILFFIFLGLLGAFLAKGTNDPFGNVYLWLFHHVPGFVMFRDSTKWYVLVAISYALLIPYTVSSVYELLQRRFRS